MLRHLLELCSIYSKIKKEHENDETKNGRFKKDSTQASRDKNKISKISTLVGYNNKLDTIEEKSSEHNDIEKKTIHIEVW